MGSPFLLPLTAVLLSAWYGGLVPGLLAGAAAAIVLAYLFLPPSDSLALDRADAIRLGVFLQLAIAWCVFITVHRSHDRERSRMLVRAEENRQRTEQTIAIAAQDLPLSLRVLRAYTQALARELEAPTPDLVLVRQLAEQIEGVLAQMETRMIDLFGPRN